MQDNSITVSVIVPIYNGAAFVDELLAGLRAQNFSDFEVILINDGSTDNTAEKLDRVQQESHDFRINVIHQVNAGVSAARNAGLRVAKGKYICFVDADDYVSADYLEVLHDAIVSSRSRIAVGHITRNRSELIHLEKPDVRIHTSTQFLREFLYRGIKYHVCACMFDRDCFTERELCFPEGFRYSEDVFVLWQLFAAEQTVAEVECKIYHYYDNPHSAMNKGIDIRRMDAIVLMQKLETILQELNPEFAPEFIEFAVARHHWSILWQAASRLHSYKEFTEYCSHFEMRTQLKKMFRYPETKLSLSALLYVISPWVYYHLLRTFIRLRNLVCQGG